MPRTVFYSWQSDTDERIGHYFLKEVLEEACGLLASEWALDEANRPEVDHDTQNVAGQVPIMETILRKIDQASAFVADLTFMPATTAARRTPNPNVLIEYGWALKSLGIGRIIWVMNKDFGDPASDDLPFDLRHHRRPICFALPKGATREQIAAQKKHLVPQLKQAIELVLRQSPREDLSESPAQANMPLPDVGLKLASMQMLGKEWQQITGRSGKPVAMGPGASLSLWLTPKRPLEMKLSATRLFQLATQGEFDLIPMFYTASHWLRAEDGIGTFCVDEASPNADKSIVLARSLAFAYEHGPIWSVEKGILSYDPSRLFMGDIEREMAQAIVKFGRLLGRMGAQKPYFWTAKLVGVKGRLMAPTNAEGVSIIGRGGYECFKEEIDANGQYDDTQKSEDVLLPFFEAIHHACGIERRKQ